MYLLRHLRSLSEVRFFYCICNKNEIEYSKGGAKMVEVLRTIGSIARALDSIANIEFKQLELAKSQYLYLVRIFEQPGIIQEQLSNELKVDRTTVARSVQKLANQGLITREQKGENQKNKQLYPTEQGKILYPLIARENKYSNNRALTGFTKSEQEQFLAFLNRVDQNLAEDWQMVKQGKQREYLKEFLQNED